MSFGTGGLAQMTYNQNSFNGGLGLPTSGFASRGKQNNVKRLSVATAKIGAVEEPSVGTPRTSRSHLLAGLRTAKSPGIPPASAPPTQLQQPGLGGSYYAKFQQQQEPPKTAVNGTFSNNYNQLHGNRPGHMYTPSQVLAPPTIEVDEAGEYGQMDPEEYQKLLRTNQYLAEQQLRLQQQLISVQNQFRNISLGQQYQPNQMSMYQQQLQQGVQPVVEPIPNQPGVYLVYNPLTGQTSFFVDPASQQQQVVPEQYMNGVQLSNSPPPPTPTFRAEVSPPEETRDTSPKNLNNPWRSQTPPKSTTPPQDNHTPLPPPSANAFRPGHRKNNLSLANTSATAADGPRTGGMRSAGFPATPMTGTFGPGQAREGEHPIRQPRGPPSMEELVAKPTSKIEGSKNFATRQRRRALNNLVRAGAERRTGTRGEDMGTPTSEQEVTFSASDTDSVHSGSASLSGRPSSGNLKSSPAAIGSERASLKERSRERGSVDSYTASSVSSEESSYAGGKLVEIKAEGAKGEAQRQGSLAVLADAERRRSLIF